MLRIIGSSVDFQKQEHSPQDTLTTLFKNENGNQQIMSIPALQMLLP